MPTLPHKLLRPGSGQSGPASVIHPPDLVPSSALSFIWSGKWTGIVVTVGHLFSNHWLRRSWLGISQMIGPLRRYCSGEGALAAKDQNSESPVPTFRRVTYGAAPASPLAKEIAEPRALTTAKRLCCVAVVPSLCLNTLPAAILTTCCSRVPRDLGTLRGNILGGAP